MQRVSAGAAGIWSERRRQRGRYPARPGLADLCLGPGGVHICSLHFFLNCPVCLTLQTRMIGINVFDLSFPEHWTEVAGADPTFVSVQYFCQLFCSKLPYATYFENYRLNALWLGMFSKSINNLPQGCRDFWELFSNDAMAGLMVGTSSLMVGLMVGFDSSMVGNSV